MADKKEIEQKIRDVLNPIAEEWAAYKMADGLCAELSKLNLALMNKNRQEVSTCLGKAHKAAHRLKRFLNPAQ